MFFLFLIIYSEFQYGLICNKCMGSMLRLSKEIYFLIYKTLFTYGYYRYTSGPVHEMCAH